MPLALLSIGINYSGQLQGCVNDTNNIIKCFSTRIPIARCWKMIDTLPASDLFYPSRRNIERQFVDIVQSANQYSHLIVHYSGHGSRIRDINRDESDRFDEVLVPADYANAGFITDDWLQSQFVKKLPNSLKVVCIFDCCHSGTALDLRYNWINARRGGFVRTDNNRNCSEKQDVTLLSGCLDSQYSYETVDATYGNSGALTSAFLNTLCKRSTRDPGLIISYIQQSIRNTKQTVSISSTRKTIQHWNFMSF